MADWDEAIWESTVESGLPRRDRRSGPYRRYIPDRLVESPLMVPAETDALIARAEQSVHHLAEDRTEDLAGISRFLLRSEAIASSRIEGIAPSANQVALAELSASEDVAHVSAQARLVANNMTVVREARGRLVAADRITVGDLITLHQSLLPDEPHHHGIRTVQNWIGGSNHHPIGADFVPPPAGLVPELLEDLLAYVNGAAHSPIVQAALVHAQFETIHPFTDGNGRVGRALIHTVLTRRGLTKHAVLPVSLVLATLSDAYIHGLTAYRHKGPVASDQHHSGRAAWLQIFGHAVTTASAEAGRLARDLASLRESWNEQLAEARARGGRRGVRSDSATAMILRDLPASPVLTAATVQRIHGVSHVAAGRALDELQNAGILQRSTRSGRQYYRSQEVLDLVTLTERRLASTRFDTRVSKPNRPVPAAPSAYRAG